jgi:hypothetical protein
MSVQRYHIDSIRKAGHPEPTAAVTDTTPITLILDMQHVDNFSCQVIWDGTVAADVAVFISNSYNPNPQDIQDETIALNPGIWTDRTMSFTADITPPAGSPGDGEIHGQWVEAAFVKIVITPTAGAGNVDLYISGKSVN